MKPLKSLLLLLVSVAVCATSEAAEPCSDIGCPTCLQPCPPVASICVTGYPSPGQPSQPIDPRYAFYGGGRGSHALHGDSGTHHYLWQDFVWRGELVFDGGDASFVYYYEKDYPTYKWAFRRTPKCSCYDVYFLPGSETGGKWVHFHCAARRKLPTVMKASSRPK